MTNTFYIISKEQFGGTMWYQLCLRDNHYCLACGGDLDTILRTIKTYVKRHRTVERLYRALNKMESGFSVSPSVYSLREDYYRVHGEDYDDLVLSAVASAIYEAKEEDKVNSPLYKTRTRIRKAGGAVVTKVTPVEVTPLVPSTQTLLRKKPKVFKHK